MFRVIEILDSDDDSAAPLPVPPTTAAAVAQPADPPTSKIKPPKEKAAPTEPSSVASCSAAATAAVAGRMRNRRKSTHQPMRSSPEMQFETIALDDDEELPAATGTSTAAGGQAQKPLKAFKTTPKILTPRPPTAEEMVFAACDEFTNSSETQSLLRRIAEERVRVNFLLASFGMPDINFSLYTQPDRLQFQLADRLKQRKMRNRGLLESKKRRSLLQPMTPTPSQGSTTTTTTTNNT